MIKKLEKKIKEYSTIIIHRHTNPDMDAIGSQLGLYHLIKDNHPEKNVYVVGDSNKYDRKKSMQIIPDSYYDNSLVFILDVAVKDMVSDDRYALAKEVIIIDHHQNSTDIEHSLYFVDVKYSSTTEYLTEIFRSLNYKFSKDAASFLFWGIVTDSGRFKWMRDPEHLLLTAGFLAGKGAVIEPFYDWLYTESLEKRKRKNYFEAKMVYEDGVAYMKNDKNVYDEIDINFFDLSRGMVNIAAGILEIKIWMNFTYDPEEKNVKGEFRSRGISIIDVAKKYGGGGHANACGAALKDFDEADLVIQDFKQLLKESEGNGK